MVQINKSTSSSITFGNSIYFANGNPWRGRGQANVRQNRAGLTLLLRQMGILGEVEDREHCGTAQGDLLAGLTLLLKSMISPTTGRVTRNQQDYYSTFHRTPNRKKFSKKEWESFTQESTQHVVAELASSPKFTDWIIKHADRIQLLPDDSSDNRIGCG
ncbi:unnamed protein product [Camellia sinensis]